MFDSIKLAEMEWAYVNHQPDALAGYVGGAWPTWSSLEALYGKYPNVKLFSIAVFASEDAECLDVETGDATIPEIYGWFVRQQSRKVWRPCVYSSADNLAGVVMTMTANGFGRSDYRIWSAHYTRTPHICGPTSCGYPQADGTQWTDSYNGRNLDASLLASDFFGGTVSAAGPQNWDNQDWEAFRRQIERGVLAHVLNGYTKNLSSAEAGDVDAAHSALLNVLGANVPTAKEIAAAVVAALPPGTTSLTVADVETAVKKVFAQAAA